MFDARKLLDQLVGPQGGALADDLLTKGRDLLGQGTDAIAGQASQAFGQETVDKARDYLSRNAEQLGIGAAAGGLLGVLLGSDTGRKVGGTVLQAGALAAIGGLAWKAYSQWQASKGGQPAATGEAPPAIEHPGGEQGVATALIVAMISAAKADGVVDPKEYRTILGKASEAGLDLETNAFLEAELSSPVDIDKVVAASTSPQMAVQLYAASALAITPDRNSEKAYLTELASRLGLEPGLVAEVEARIAAARAAG
ncbi:tellurite resistance TerB family protein [Prosthecodimorpha staleyi]|uniref:Tellurite resistance TerB family protein n=1 Tax=Prosthecodimorpha staleyi TaxID=2840188 RepID=A0A947GGY4_9HYPH|nr:tellurite resistance TerB family protein [Prosthecodimorpha staleyi]MBT9293030.1 tellurite resistance TerB family protein [Prosthecodimorpha staleyi]